MASNRKFAAVPRELSNGEVSDGKVANGPEALLQRDYWVEMQKCDLEPGDVIRLVRQGFELLSPEYFAGRTASSLRLGEGRVRLVHETDSSFTLHTLEGLPKAGRITFAARRLSNGDLEFRVRSRARERDALRWLGYQLIGQHSQTDVWVEFVNRVTKTCKGKCQQGVQFLEKQISVSEESQKAPALSLTSA